MQLLRRHRLRRFARTIMFVAISAFMLQGVLISISQAAAAAGTMLEPAVTLSGSVHFHDHLAGHVHDHGDDAAVGHVHDGSGSDHEDAPGGSHISWTIFGSSIAIPTVVVLIPSSDFLGLVELPAGRTADGVEPAALIRPPSTLSLA
jgi:hypothetical protein